MTDLQCLAAELERLGGVHRFNAVVRAATQVLLRHEHGALGAGMSDRAARDPLGSSPMGRAVIESYRAVRDAIRQQEVSEAEARCRCGETPLADCQDERPPPPQRRVPRYPNPETDGA